jgi:hypothetical protein
MANKMYPQGLYNSYYAMMTRCYNAKCPDKHKYYQGKGITVCEAWHKVAGFYADMGSTWSRGMTLDRIDPKGDYTPENTRWLSRSENCSRSDHGKGTHKKKHDVGTILKCRKAKEAKSKGIIGDGVRYVSISEAAREMGFKSVNSIVKRCANPNFTGWYYAD